jgi:hypothetical protein
MNITSQRPSRKRLTKGNEPVKKKGKKGEGK